jgi:hypothetical protein
MPNFTPGPWTWQRGGEYEASYLRSKAAIQRCPDSIEFDGNDPIHDDGSAGGEYGPSIDIDGPNAQLIAAAPDLYAALDELLKFGAHDGPCDNCDPETGEPYDEAGACDAHWNACKAREQIARAALAKARGEKPNAE